MFLSLHTIHRCIKVTKSPYDYVPTYIHILHIYQIVCIIKKYIYCWQTYKSRTLFNSTYQTSKTHGWHYFSLANTKPYRTFSINIINMCVHTYRIDYRSVQSLVRKKAKKKQKVSVNMILFFSLIFHACGKVSFVSIYVYVCSDEFFLHFLNGTFYITLDVCTYT